MRGDKEDELRAGVEQQVQRVNPLCLLVRCGCDEVRNVFILNIIHKLFYCIYSYSYSITNYKTAWFIFIFIYIYIFYYRSI